MIWTSPTAWRVFGIVLIVVVSISIVLYILDVPHRSTMPLSLLAFCCFLQAKVLQLESEVRRLEARAADTQETQ